MVSMQPEFPDNSILEFPALVSFAHIEPAGK